MFFELKGKTYHVKFRREGTTTFAKLFVVNETGKMEDTEIEGKAVLYHTDRFNKSTGRKTALADLLWIISIPDEDGVIPEGITKEEREKVIWKAYFEIHRK